MKEEQIHKIIDKNNVNDTGENMELHETHISWVILSDHYAYKIKKPVTYSFLDFSTLDRRKRYCEKELKLNKRLAENEYLKVLPVHNGDNPHIDEHHNGDIIDYAVQMKRLQESKKMDNLLKKDFVDTRDIEKLATKVADFHLKTEVISKSFDLEEYKDKFNDIDAITDFVNKDIDMECGDLIKKAQKISDEFLENNQKVLAERSKEGFIRDCHGDLHSRNIFLLNEPVIFDCIEFNDEFRYIDVLDEIAFFCMDLDYFEKYDLSALFYTLYMKAMGMEQSFKIKQLFNYYKSYRANVRAKVISMRLMKKSDEKINKHRLQQVKRYLVLMQNYLGEL